jgi:ribosome assembly protein RRB1
MFLVSGSQADRVEKNKLTILHISDLHKTYVAPDSDDDDEDNDKDDEEDDDNDLDEDPIIDHVNINHYGSVNRIRAMTQQVGLIATMAETGNLHIYDVSNLVQSMMTNDGNRPAIPTQPIFTSSRLSEEGYAIDWSPTVPGRIICGDNTGRIYLYNPTTNLASWEGPKNLKSTNNNNNGLFHSHSKSVEDLQWSPHEPSVFASCSVDQTIRIWDIRDTSKSQITYQAHVSDINVISWNSKVGYLLASGCDDGSFKVWDLRRVRNDISGSSPLAHFTYHTEPITSLEWNPHDESMISMTSADDQLSIWDLSVESESASSSTNAASTTNNQSSSRTASATESEYPPQLLFLHLGQHEVKEVHFHKQIPGVIVSTAEDSFNIFKPAITVSN